MLTTQALVTLPIKPALWRRKLGRAKARATEMLTSFRTRRALYELDASALRDIGITRLDAVHEARRPFWK